MDTSVWVEFFRSGRSDGPLAEQIVLDAVSIHPAVTGELALGDLGASRAHVLDGLGALSLAPVLSDDEVMGLIRQRRLFGSGIGWVDAHLLGSALVGPMALCTRDRTLARAATRCGVDVVRW